MVSAGIMLAAPMDLPLFWSWAWVAVVLVVFLTIAAGAAIWTWAERRHARRLQGRSGARAVHDTPPPEGLPKAA
jgi:NADH:ubiquinone oxidoreductase subunit H